MDFSGLAPTHLPLKYNALKKSDPLSTGYLFVSPFVTDDTFAAVCRLSRFRQTPEDLKGVSRAIPDLDICCALDNTFFKDVDVLTTERDQVSPRKIYQQADTGVCSGSGVDPERTCVAAKNLSRPWSPNGEACLELVGNADTNGDGIPDVGHCVVRGLTLVPPDPAGGVFPSASLLREGPIEIRFNFGERLLRVFRAVLGQSGTAGTDGDGDGVPDRFDFCPMTAENPDLLTYLPGQMQHFHGTRRNPPQ